MKSNLFLVSKALILIIWLVSGLYFGSGGLTQIENENLLRKSFNDKDTVQVIYNNTRFSNEASLIRIIENEKMNKIYPWINSLPSYLTYIITACSFGLTGSIVRIFIKLTIENKSLKECQVFSLPILGMLTGLVILGISLIFPAILISAEINIKASGLLFVCLFGGIFVESFYAKFSNLFSNFFLVSK